MPLTPRDKRILQVAGVAIPLFLIVYLFVLRPDDGEELALPSGPTGTPTGTTGLPAESPSATPSPTPRETLPPVSLAGSRDPFSIPPGLEIAGGSVSPTTTGVPTTTVPPATTVPPTTTQPPVTTTPPPVTTTPPPVTTTPPPPGGGGEGNERPPNKILIGGHDVKLVSVSGSGKKLDVRVDGRVYTVQPGATFAVNFKLVKIDGRCAKFLFGDQSFELCER
ncbi:MAG TPA: hypothetical protein VFM81_04970 [Actinomycetota bacterium]|nr:hypothetical protein [Actinomycetota bacterium]